MTLTAHQSQKQKTLDEGRRKFGLAFRKISPAGFAGSVFGNRHAGQS
jgi:hypothetical protein